jgi:hypothetical protein
MLEEVVLYALHHELTHLHFIHRHSDRKWSKEWF